MSVKENTHKINYIKEQLEILTYIIYNLNKSSCQKWEGEEKKMSDAPTCNRSSGKKHKKTLKGAKKKYKTTNKKKYKV